MLKYFGLLSIMLALSGILSAESFLYYSLTRRLNTNDLYTEVYRYDVGISSTTLIFTDRGKVNKIWFGQGYHADEMLQISADHERLFANISSDEPNVFQYQTGLDVREINVENGSLSDSLFKAPDGRNFRVSADGRHILFFDNSNVRIADYETGKERSWTKAQSVVNCLDIEAYKAGFLKNDRFFYQYSDVACGDGSEGDMEELPDHFVMGRLSSDKVQVVPFSKYWNILCTLDANTPAFAIRRGEANSLLRWEPFSGAPPTIFMEKLEGIVIDADFTTDGDLTAVSLRTQSDLVLGVFPRGKGQAIEVCRVNGGDSHLNLIGWIKH